MTKRAPVTEAMIKRTIAAARKSGLDVNAISVSPDGTITVHHMAEGVAQPVAGTQNGPASEWEDFQA
jgi:hypothetical protein